MDDDLPLDPGETVTASYRQSPVALVPYVLVAGALAAGAAVALPLSIRITNGSLSVALNAAGSLLVGLTVATLAAGWLTYRRTRLVVTTQHVYLVLQVTPFNRSTTSVRLARVVDVFGRRAGITQTLFDYGRVEIETLGDDDFFGFSPVSSPETVARAVENPHDAYAQAYPGQSV